MSQRRGTDERGSSVRVDLIEEDRPRLILSSLLCRSSKQVLFAYAILNFLLEDLLNILSNLFLNEK